MLSKYEAFSQMADNAARQVTGSYQNWTAFLQTAARLYKYPYHEQLMIFAQRPDATACADFDFWNEKMGRYVRKGSKGIALIDPSGEHPRLRYVFDVSDTESKKNGRRVNPWVLTDGSVPAVAEMLAQNYSVEAGSDLREQIEAITEQLAEEYWATNRTDILGILADSFLAGYDEYSVGLSYRTAVSVSAAYAIMSRCGLDPEQYFRHEDFMNVFDWSTPNTAAAIGTAASGIAQQVLRQIEVEARKQMRAERSKENERTDLQTDRRLPDPQSDPQRAGGEAVGQVRQDAQDVSERTPPDSVEPTPAEREPVSAPAGDRRDSEPANGTDAAGTDEAQRGDRGAESAGPVDLGGDDEQPQSAGGGDYPERVDLQLSLFPTEEEQILRIEEAERAANAPSAFPISVPQDAVDRILRFSGNQDNGRLRIVSEFSKGKGTEQNAAFLQSIFRGGNGIILDEQHYAAWYDEAGIHIAAGRSARHARFAQVVPWNEAAERIGAMLQEGTFATNVELAEANHHERKQLAQSLWYLHQDLTDEARESGYLGFYDRIRGGGFPEETDRLAELLTDPQFLEVLIPQVNALYLRQSEGDDLLRYHFHKPGELLEGLKELSLPRTEYTSEMAKIPQTGGFITEDEIEQTLSGGNGFQGGKGRIYTFTKAAHTTKELADFLKEEYGTGGRSHAVSGATHSEEDHSAKGIRLRKAGCAEVQMNWTDVAKRIEELIRSDRYLPPEEREKLDAARGIPAAYNAVKEQHPDSIVLFQVGDFFEVLGEDAKLVAQELDLHLTARRIPGVGQVDMCGFPAFQLEGYTERLRDKHDITISPTPDEGGERSAYTMRSFDHEAEKAVNEREAEFGADGYRAFPGNALEEETPKNEAVFIGERGNTLYFYAPVSFGIETDFGDAPKLNEGQRMVVASPVCYHPADFLNAHKITFLKIGREIEEQQITQNGPSKQIDAMQEAMVYRTPENHTYQIGDVVDGVTGGNHLRFTIENVDGDHVYANFPEVSDLVAMVRGRFDAYLDDGRLNVVQEDTPAPAVEEPVPDSFPYAAGDTVYLEDGKPFVIEDVGIFDVHLRDPSLLYPVSRSESKENFARLLERYPQPTADYTTEPVAEYPAEETGLPYDVVVQTIKATEPDPPVQNFRITDDHLGEGGAKAKFRANMDAINLLHKLEAGNRQATPEEQDLLSKFVGWGGLADAFDDSKPAWAEEYKELRSALTPEEYASARASTLNAHYTSPVVIRAVYEALSNMGFTGGNILEPSMGIGNFFGMLPNEMSGSKLYGVELDGLTGRIAKQLYPQADITVAGFETTDRSDFFDVAIGNVPFGQYQVNDPAYNKLGFNIHNYFFAKALDQVRPGGIVAFITSRYTLDSKDTAVRKYLAQRAELLGAIRLPNNAFKANAGTDVVSDIIFLQKRDRPITVEPDWIYLEENEDGYAINSYFLEHPEMILGQQSSESTQFGRMDFTVAPLEGVELKDQLAEAITHIEGTYKEAELPDLGEGEEIDTSIPADPSVKNYSYTLVDGEVYYRENSRMVKPNLNATAIERVKGMIALRNCLQKLIEKQLDGYVSDEEIRQIQVELNRIYDSFTAKYGLITGRANEMAFSDDSSYYLLSSLEILDEDKKLERKADIFTKRTIRPHEVVTSVDTASEALALSISEHASVEIPYMEELTGKTEEELVSDLRGVIFQVPPEQTDAAREYQTADEYLSGNVRQKLRTAEEAAKNDSAFLPNVEALRKAQPKDLDASDIEVRLGATWIDKSIIEQFMYETFQTPHYLQWSCKVNYSPFTAEWAISAKTQCSYADVNAYVTYGTQRANAYKILEDSLNLRDVRIYDTVQDADGKERRVLNSKETTLAQQKQQMIKDAFANWIWKDPERRQKLVAKYNELFNSDRPREYDGQHLAFPAMNPEIQLRGHQLNAVAHIIYGGNTLLAHEVGAGKTFEMVAAAMESKRLGLCQKPLFAVPNHLTEQWASEFLRLYPSANILVAKKKDFEPRNRKKFCARIATGNYDAVIIGHSQFERIPVSQARQERLLQDQIDEIEEGIVELKASRAERFTVKQLEKTKRSLEIKLKKLQDTKRKDDVVTFEELGVDRLYVDEAHNYKNLFLYTKMRNVAGLSTTDAQKSSDMLLKCRYLDEITGGKGVVFATGTPVSNSMTELYTMMRYLQHDTLRYRGLSHFDCWASTFGETATAIELAPEGTGYRARTRFSKFFNLPELMALFKQVADIKTSDQLNLPVPEAIYHNVVAQPTEVQQEMVQQLSKRASRVHAGVVAPTEDNMLKITSDGRKLGLDQRIINPDLPDDPQSKVNQCVDNVFRIWQEGEPQKLTQLIFCDLSTPSGKSAQSSITAKGLPESSELHAVESLVEEEPQEQAFCVYDDIREKLVARGVPREQIAFIHEANTDNRKAELFAKVRAGQVRVLLGSTFKMGAGMNVQDRLIALHDLDAPWRPGDLEQRSGRIVRQGNRNPQVHIYRYVTEATFDAYLWQTLENKQKFISQIMTSKSPVRSCEDVDETALSYAEIKALCAGDERIKEKMDLDIDVAKLKLMKASHNSQQYRLEDNLLKTFPEQAERFTGIIAGYQADMKTLSAHPHPTDGFAGMTVRSAFFNDKEAAGNALLSAMKDAHGLEPLPVGTYRGFKMYLTLEDFGREYVLTLKGELAHRVTLGKDARGNLTRIDNVLTAMPDRMKTAQAQLENVYKQIEAAKAELGKPFPQEEELRTKSARLAQLNAELDIDDKAPSEQLADDGEQAPSRDGVPLMEKLRQAKEAVQEQDENRPQKSFSQETER